jgi:hypothetical protein
MKKDFDFIVSLMTSFVKQKHIQNRLNFIDNHYVTGWETWLQIEFAHFINSHENVSEWSREDQFSTDKRKSKFKDKIAIDFLVRQKGFSKDKYIALELKQHYSIETCIAYMMDDIAKLDNVKLSETNFRSFWNIGIHPRDNKTTIKNKIIKKMKQKDIDLYNEFREIRYIPSTSYAFTIF